MEARLLGQLGEEVAQAPIGNGQKTPVGGDAHDGLGDAQRDDLGVCDAAAGVVRSLREDVVGRAVDGGAEKVEVGVQRGLLVDGALDTADFGLSALCPPLTAPAVESVI